MKKALWQLNALFRCCLFSFSVLKLRLFIRRLNNRQSKSFTIEIQAFKTFAKNPALLLAILFLMISILLFLSTNENPSIEKDLNLTEVENRGWIASTALNCIKGKPKGFYLIEYQDTSIEAYYNEQEIYAQEAILDEETTNCYSIPKPTFIQEITL
ncbi:MAG: hypothetical protein M9962_00285 [Oligoflexia bacterium]|nr:hypothetical protein [Oligoflexia bacterium]